jgi:hypothetical protein
MKLRHCIHRELVNCRFQFHKRSQLFIGSNNETLSVVNGVRLQSRSFARRNQSLRHSPNPKENERISTTPFLLWHFSPGNNLPQPEDR